MSGGRTKDKTVIQLIAEAKKDLVLSRKELEERLEFRLGHGARMRAAIRDREKGEQVILVNNENNREILMLKEKIKKLEKFLR